MTRFAPILAAALVALIAVPATAVSESGKPLYTVQDGNRVDENTYEGFKTWRAAACDRCHGPNQEGMVGPSLIESMKRLGLEEFRQILLEGRLDKGMPAWKTNEKVVEHMDALYAYLKGRSDGAITTARVKPLAKE